MATTTWDPSNKSPSLTLSGGNLTATCTAGHSANLIRATNSQTTGKYYCEHNWTTMSGAGDEGFGICNATQSMSSTTLWLGHDGNPSNGIGNYNGLVYLNGGNFVVSFPPMTANKLFGFACDLTHGKLWYWNPLAAGQTGGEWNGDVLANQNPSTNTGGIDIVTAHPLTGVGSTAFFPCMDMEDNAAVGTTNFGATTYSISGTAIATSISGFSNWDGTSIGGGGTLVAPRGLILPRRMKSYHHLILPARFQAKKLPLQTANLPQPIKVGLRVPLQVLKVKRRKPLKVKLNRLLPQLVRPPRPIPKVTKIVFRKRPLKRTYFLPKHWMPVGQHANPVHPPIAVGLYKPWPMLKKRVKRIQRWKVIKKSWPLPQFQPPKEVAIWLYGAGPYGGGPYSSAIQLTVLGGPAEVAPIIENLPWIYSAAPWGSGPFSAGGRVKNPPPVGPPLQGSVVAPAGPIRVADPYVSVVRSTTPALAQTRKAVPSLQQVRTNPPKLNK